MFLLWIEPNCNISLSSRSKQDLYICNSICTVQYSEEYKGEEMKTSVSYYSVFAYMVTRISEKVFYWFFFIHPWAWEAVSQTWQYTPHLDDIGHMVAVTVPKPCICCLSSKGACS